MSKKVYLNTRNTISTSTPSRLNRKMITCHFSRISKTAPLCLAVRRLLLLVLQITAVLWQRWVWSIGEIMLRGRRKTYGINVAHPYDCPYTRRRATTDSCHLKQLLSTNGNNDCNPAILSKSVSFLLVIFITVTIIELPLYKTSMGWFLSISSRSYMTSSTPWFTRQCFHFSFRVRLIFPSRSVI